MVGRACFHEAWPVAFAYVRIQRELGYRQHAAVHVVDGTVHFAVLVFENAQVGDFVGEPVDLFRSVRIFHSDKQHIADAYMLWFECGVDFSACLVDHVDGSFADLLQYDAHIPSRSFQPA